MSKNSAYDKEFYKLNKGDSRRSAEHVVPIILSLFDQVDSVVDLGCGTGTWLSVFREIGVKEIFGVDGNYVDRDLLMIPQESFIPFDLSKPLDIKKKFDLAVSLEVAEHIPSESAKIFVDSLCRHSDNVVFSAAIPWQGGTHHVNEQLQSYWAKLFESNGYVPMDYIRPTIWGNAEIEVHYRQNVILFSKTPSDIKKINAPSILDIIHPEFIYTSGLRSTLKMQSHIFKTLPKAIRRVVNKRIKVFWKGN